MRRREFIAALGGAATWPLVARTQEWMRRIAYLAGIADTAEGRGRLAAFTQALAGFGWVEGRNIQIEARWGEADPNIIRKHATELAARAPDVILASGGLPVAHLLAATRTVPIVFTIVPDPVGSGYVKSLSRPGINATGFMQFEYSLSGKWLELLKEIAPTVTRVGVLWDPSFAAGVGQFAIIQAVAPSLSIEVFPIDVRDLRQLEDDIAALGGMSNGGMMTSANPTVVSHRDLIVTLAARHRLPTVYNLRDATASGGLISYGADFKDQFRRAAGYVDRILKGEKPADLPVQAPTKYDLVINLKTAKTLGLTIPSSVIARADEVIE